MSILNVTCMLTGSVSCYFVMFLARLLYSGRGEVSLSASRLQEGARFSLMSGSAMDPLESSLLSIQPLIGEALPLLTGAVQHVGVVSSLTAPFSPLGPNRFN